MAVRAELGRCVWKCDGERGYGREPEIGFLRAGSDDDGRGLAGVGDARIVGGRVGDVEGWVNGVGDTKDRALLLHSGLWMDAVPGGRGYSEQVGSRGKARELEAAKVVGVRGAGGDRAAISETVFLTNQPDGGALDWFGRFVEDGPAERPLWMELEDYDSVSTPAAGDDAGGERVVVVVAGEHIARGVALKDEVAGKNSREGEAAILIRGGGLDLLAVGLAEDVDARALDGLAVGFADDGAGDAVAGGLGESRSSSCQQKQCEAES